MSNLGVIGTLTDGVVISVLDSPFAHTALDAATYGINTSSQRVIPYRDNWKTFSGSVVANGVPAQRKVVAIRIADLPVQTTTMSDVSGDFTLPIPDGAENYITFAIGATGEDSDVIDRVNPV